MKRSRLFLWLFILLAAVTVFTVAQEMIVKQTKPTETVTVLDEMLQLIKKNSIYEPKEGALVEGALKGMAAAINDPYSTYYTKEEAKLHESTLAEQKAGIGIELSERNGKFIIITPMKGSPAEKAGIRPLDEIVQIDDVKLSGQSMQKVLKLLQRDVGQEIEFVLYRASIDEHIRLKIKVQQMKNKTVTAETITVQDVPLGLISIRLFGENTATEWLQATEQLSKQNIKGLIVDVRGNPGGYLHSVAGVLGSLQKKGVIFAYMQDNKGVLEPLVTEPPTENYSKLKWPLVVLQNEGSASASEVFSGALKVWDAATIIGSKSFGKGTVQRSWDLNNGGQVKLSTSKWLMPNEQWIHQIGIEPHIEVEQHGIFSIEQTQLTKTYERGDYSTDISYVQRALFALGYSVGEVNGFYGDQLEDAVLLFKEREKAGNGTELDATFYKVLQQEIIDAQNNEENDLQLQMAIGYLMHNIQNN